MKRFRKRYLLFSYSKLYYAGNNLNKLKIMSFIDPNSPSFKAGVATGRILRKILLWSSLGLFGYILGKYSNKNTNKQIFPNKDKGGL